MKKIVAFVALALLIGVYVGRAQNTTPFTIQVNSTFTHVNCPAAIASTTQYCFAYDGEWVSTAGAAYVLTATSTGVTSLSVNGGTAQTGAVTLSAVTSWNAQSGVVTYTAPAAPVTSVNGKTGVVVLGATSTTTIQ